jgi:ribosomal protein L15
MIVEIFEDGEKVSAETLIHKGFSSKKIRNGIKILSVGEISKKLVIEATSISKNALRKLEEKNIEFKLV